MFINSDKLITHWVELLFPSQTPTIKVSLMDGTWRMLNLVSGANTTVQQLHQQMMRVWCAFFSPRMASLNYQFTESSSYCRKFRFQKLVQMFSPSGFAPGTYVSILNTLLLSIPEWNFFNVFFNALYQSNMLLLSSCRTAAKTRAQTHPAFEWLEKKNRPTSDHMGPI